MEIGSGEGDGSCETKLLGGDGWLLEEAVGRLLVESFRHGSQFQSAVCGSQRIKAKGGGRNHTVGDFQIGKGPSEAHGVGIKAAVDRVLERDVARGLSHLTWANEN